MAAQRTSFEKLQRDRAKKAKAAAKREKRQGAETPEAAAAVIDEPLAGDDHEGELSAGELLERIESIHRRYDAKQMTFEEFEEEKAELLRRLPID